MSERETNLLRAARFIRRLDATVDGAMDIEGVPASDVAYAIERAAIDSLASQAIDNALHSVRVPSNVVEFSDYLNASGRPV